MERTVEEIEKERKSLENSLYQQNIKNTNLQDEISDLKRRSVNVENRHKNELEAEREKVCYLLFTVSLSCSFVPQIDKRCNLITSEFNMPVVD